MKRITATLGLGALLVVSAGCGKLRSRYEMNQGIQAYKNKEYNNAEKHFTEAIKLDPQNINGKLYRATTWMVQYAPGARPERNKGFADKARAGFLDVLKDEPKNESALENLAYLCLQEAGTMENLTPEQQEEKNKKLDEAKGWFEKVLQIDDKNRDAWYSLGVIAWRKWYTPLMSARSTVGMKPEDPGPIPDAKIRQELREKYSAIVDDGIQKLERAHDLDKNYDDAMAYLNLLYRERADLAESPDQFKQDMAQADKYFESAKAAQKARLKVQQNKQPAE